MSKEEILLYIRENIAEKTYKEMSLETGLSADALRGRARRAGIKKPGRVNKRTKGSYNKELLSKGSTLQLIEEFTRVGDHLKHQCTKCNAEVVKRPQDVLLTPNCQACSAKATREASPLEDMLQNLPDRYVYISGYSGLAKKCKFLCKKCEKIWEVQPTRIISGGINCPTCKSIETSIRCRKPLDEVKEKCSEYGLEFLDKEYLGNKHDHLFKNIACGHEFLYKFNYIKPQTCKVCAEYRRTSAGEREVAEYIKSLGFSVSKEYLQDGKELDIVVKEKNLAIEYNGNYWHSDKLGKDYSYHLSKTKNSKYDLVHIYEFMWNSNKELLKSMIMHRLGVTPNRVYARKCGIKEVSSATARGFLDANHIQGFLAGCIYLALTVEDSIVALMTFNKARFNSGYEYEIGRYSVLKNYSVVGGASRLFKYFIKLYNPTSIISYCHRFYSNGSLYHSLGMKLLRETRPGYWYLDPNGSKVYSRQQFQKHKLKDKLENFDNKLSEKENMENNGYSRIYDCGNLVFGWKNTY